MVPLEPRLGRRRLLGSVAVLPLAGLAGLAGCGGTSGRPRSSAQASRTASPPHSGARSPGSSATSSGRGSPAPRIVATLAEDLDVPWGLALLPDGTALVSCRDSFEIVHVRPGGARTVGVVPDVTTNVDSGGEAGLLGLALHPAYPRVPWLYAYHSTTTDNRVVRMTYAAGRLGPPDVILDGIAVALHHNGGGLRFGPDGHLFVSTGDAEDSAHAQDTGSLNGKILRITDRGGVPPGNPFHNPVWSYGHRNVEGLAFDPEGRLWASEFGDHAYDELNLIERGGNYGWPSVEGSDGPGGYRDPLAQWPTDDSSPSGLAIARGRAWLGALQGECLWSADLATGHTERFLDGHGRLRLVAAAPDGSLWVGTSHRDGRATPGPGDDRIYRVTL